MRDDIAENNAIDRSNQGSLCHLPQGQMLTEQTTIDRDPVRMLAGVPAWHFLRNRFGVVMTVVVMMMMSMIMVVVPMIFGHCHRVMGMAWQVRVLTAGPGMNYLSKKLYHQIGGNQSVATKLPHRIPRGHD